MQKLVSQKLFMSSDHLFNPTLSVFLVKVWLVFFLLWFGLFQGVEALNYLYGFGTVLQFHLGH
jgi:hypothetical protein